MKLVEPLTRTTLVADRNHQGFGFMTARAAIKHLITGRVRGVDASGYDFSWDGANIDNVSDPATQICWCNNNIVLYPEQPYLRSAPNTLTGEETRRYIPTVVICTHHFGYHARKGEYVSLKTIYKVYKGICQYCLQHIPFHEATKDHHFPKAKGGSNHDFNIALSCKKCNNAKADTFPYYDINGKLVKPKKIINTGLIVPDIEDIRDEWKPYLFLE